MKEYRFQIDEDTAGMRIDKCLSEAYEELSRAYIQKLIKDRLVLINGRVCKPSSVADAGDQIFFSTPDSVIPDILPENIPLEILYEDEDVIVVNKPKGMVVHPAAGHYSGTLVNALMYHCRDLSGINGVLRPGIVHRIDKDTTGAVIACKNDRAHESIAAQLKEHSIDREYIAIVCGNIMDATGSVDAPIGRDKKDRKRMCVDFSSGKRAVTHFTVLERFSQYTFVKCRLETGRTHQIRVHMAYIKHPVLGDEVYSGTKVPWNLTGQTLHARTLGFTHPKSGERIFVEAPVPEYFERILKDLRRREGR
ncbi:MAG: RluA family pseudouridine synthase [Lachnospiraceae bacterium]|nr:RluA family pseudouridine synthase [Lachnospiraceae bacterium]